MPLFLKPYYCLADHISDSSSLYFPDISLDYLFTVTPPTFKSSKGSTANASVKQNKKHSRNYLSAALFLKPSFWSLSAIIPTSNFPTQMPTFALKTHTILSAKWIFLLVSKGVFSFIWIHTHATNLPSLSFNCWMSILKLYFKDPFKVYVLDHNLRNASIGDDISQHKKEHYRNCLYVNFKDKSKIGFFFSPTLPSCPCTWPWDGFTCPLHLIPSQTSRLSLMSIQEEVFFKDLPEWNTLLPL